MRGRRRKARFTWFPTLGTNYQSDAGANNIWQTTFRLGPLRPNLDNAIGPGTAANGAMEVFPVVPDFTSEPSEQLGSTQVTLRDYVGGNEWLLKRLVGKIHIAVTPLSVDNPPAWAACLVKAGFFVARNQDDNQAEIDLTDDEVDPFAADNVANPWIWQRSWMLNSPAVAGIETFPLSTGGYGSVLDGPHIDTKVARRIRREERLWFVLAVVGYDPANTVVLEHGLQVDGLMDLRVLGALRRQQNKSAF